MLTGMHKLTIILIIFIAVSGVFVGCQKKQLQNVNTEKTTTNAKPGSMQNNTHQTVPTNQKIVYIRENDDISLIDQQNAAMKAFVDSGYSQVEIMKLGGIEENAYKALENIKKSKPGVVVISPQSFAHNIIAKGLAGTEIPVVITSYIEQMDLLDQRDTPKENVTGVKTFTQGIELSAIKLLDIISPINGKKAVFLNDTSEGFFPKKKVEDALSELNIELKEYEVTNTREEFRNATIKYSEDAEVGWILIGFLPRKDNVNNSVNIKEELNWFAENSLKPSVSFTESSSAAGVLCALGTDPKRVGEQAASMVIRVLGGTDIKGISAERPKSVNIAINIKTANKLGINFSNDILGSAFKVFTDYDGNFLTQ